MPDTLASVLSSVPPHLRTYTHVLDPVYELKVGCRDDCVRCLVERVLRAVANDAMSFEEEGWYDDGEANAHRYFRQHIEQQARDAGLNVGE